MKDPAFLFYSKDFYEGTRTMLPEERACYIDLMIYQHQHDIIPDDPKRLKMYCSGCSEETILIVLNQKFIKTVDGWLNQKLNQVVDVRSKFKPKRIASATLAGLISASKLSNFQKKKIKESFKASDFIDENNDETLIKSKVRDWFDHLVDQMVNNIANANAIANENISLEGTGDVSLAGHQDGHSEAEPFPSNPQNSPEQPETLQFPFSSAEFMKSWNELAAMPKWKKKPPSSLQKSLNKLAKYNEKFAVMLIDNAIAGNYQGVVFDDTDKKFMEWRQNANNHGNTARKKDYTLVR